jgi:hypothetical protein
MDTAKLAGAGFVQFPNLAEWQDPFGICSLEGCQRWAQFACGGWLAVLGDAVASSAQLSAHEVGKHIEGQRPSPNIRPRDSPASKKLAA